MMLRPYQQQAIEDTYAAWESGKRSVCLVIPTGGGKTVVAEHVMIREREQHHRMLFIVHRRELLRQTADRIRKRFGRMSVGLISPGEELNMYLPIQVATVQTLLARDVKPPADLMFWDECHHVLAESWRAVADHYSSTRMLGLTATPERQDGKPLGDICNHLVVGATYSQLLNDGFLVGCRVFQPPSELGAGKLAVDPFDAYQKYAPGLQVFAFAPSVEMAQQLTERANASGVPAACIHGKLKRGERDQILTDFRSGKIRLLANYNILTEGVDVPEAAGVILGRQFDHVGAFLQAVGRVLRPSPGKDSAIIIDLTGATLRHGMPVEDREYSLDGSGIRRSSAEPLRNCLQCGATLHASVMVCPDCGYRFKKRDPRIPVIYSLELREVYAGAGTPSDAKEREYKRLRELARVKGWSLWFVQKNYHKLFGVYPVIRDATVEERRTEYERLLRTAKEKGYKPGYVKIRFKEMFGEWPGGKDMAA
jgi:DNA repair protein RadD